MECLTFRELFSYVKKNRGGVEDTPVADHIRMCQKCAEELRLVKRLYKIIQKKKKEGGPSSGSHISDETWEGYFQGSLKQKEKRQFEAHLAECPVCQATIETLSVTAILEPTEEEKAVVARIQATQVPDRLSDLKKQFRPRRNPVARWLDAGRWQLKRVPGRVYVMATIAVAVAFLILLNFQLFKLSTNLDRSVEETFSAVKSQVFIRFSELRPSGGFQASSLFAKSRTRGESSQITKGEIALLEKAIEQAPGQARYYHYLGTCYFFDNRMDAAEKAYLKALELNPGNAQIYNDLALIDVEKKDFQQALAHLQKAIDLSPDLLEARYNIAMVKELLNQREQAITAWQKYLELDTDQNSTWRRFARDHLQDLLNTK